MWQVGLVYTYIMYMYYVLSLGLTLSNIVYTLLKMFVLSFCLKYEDYSILSDDSMSKNFYCKFHIFEHYMTHACKHIH